MQFPSGDEQREMCVCVCGKGVKVTKRNRKGVGVVGGAVRNEEERVCW